MTTFFSEVILLYIANCVDGGQVVSMSPVPMSTFARIRGNTSLTIRYEYPKNNQIQGVKFEKDYLIDNILCVETLHETSKE